MEIFSLLSDPELADMRHIWLIALAAGLSVVVMCGILSPLVVVKRLGFVGQGVSHSAFGGIGISGIGREGGDFALDFYSDLKTLQIADGTTARSL